MSRFATRKRVYNQIDKQKRLKIRPLRVVSKLLHSARYLYELRLKRLELFAIVLSVNPVLRWNRGIVAHGPMRSLRLRSYCRGASLE